MKTTEIDVSLRQVRSWLCLPESLADFVSLMQLRLMLLGVFTAVVGLAIAPDHPDLLRASLAILAIATGTGAAGVLNRWYGADIDAVMTRTPRRPIPRGKISRPDALVFGLVLAGASVAVLALALNIKAAVLLAFAIFFYVVVYTIWRRTPQNIVIGAAGALPPVIGWAAATGLSDNMTMPAELMNCVCSPERMAISGGVKCFTVSRL
jgi:heme o synthase